MWADRPIHLSLTFFSFRGPPACTAARERTSEDNLASTRGRKTTRRARPPTHGGVNDAYREGHPCPPQRAPEPERLPQDALGGQLRRIPRYRARAPRGDAERLPAPLRHDHLARDRGGAREQGQGHTLPLFHRVRRPPRPR